MPNKHNIELPSKGIWSDMREVKNREIRHLKITAGEEKTVVDLPMTLDLRIIPRIFTAPFQALGLVTSIFTRMTNTKIRLQVNGEDE